jgi:hypothetical protein
MVGELLGDGSITFPGKRGNNARFVITIGIDNYPYLLHLRYDIYKDLCTDTKPIPYPNPDKTGKPVQQHWFGTKSLLAGRGEAPKGGRSPPFGARKGF